MPIADQNVPAVNDRSNRWPSNRTDPLVGE
jgi:hypothetical protein